MRILFMDTYFPGLFRFLVPYVANKLGGDGENEIIFLSEYKRRDFSIQNVRQVTIRYPKAANTHPIAEQIVLNAVQQSEAFAHGMQQLKKNGFQPDIVVSTEPCSVEINNVFPNSYSIVYFDLYYNSLVDDILISKGKLVANKKKPLHLRNAFQLSSMLSCHRAIVPSRLQKESFPTIFQDKISILPMGIDAEFLNLQDALAQKTLAQKTLAQETVAQDNLDQKTVAQDNLDQKTVAQDNLDQDESKQSKITIKIRPELTPLLSCSELITWSSRNPNEYAAFSTVCKAIPRMLAARPQSQVVIITHNAQFAMEQPDCAALMKVAHARVHIFGQLTWNEYSLILKKSTVHIFMTARPPLPTTLLEAMCSGALVVASDTRSVRDIIEHKVNGFLVDFFCPISIADATINALELKPRVSANMRQKAREHVMQNYAAQKLIPQHYQQILECLELIEENSINVKKHL